MRVAVSITLTHDEQASTPAHWRGGEAWKHGGSCELRLCWPPPQAKGTRRSPTNWARCARRSRCGATASPSSGWPGSEGSARGGRPSTAKQKFAARIVKTTTTRETPAAATHCARSRTLAEHLGTSPSMVQRVWKETNLQPHRVKTFKVSNDPHFAEKLVDVVGLYLNPPEHAIVLCVDEKTRLWRPRSHAEGPADLSRPSGHPDPRLQAPRHHHAVRGEINVAEGIVIDACMSRHRHQEWIKFLKHIDAATNPEAELHLVADHYCDPQASQGTAVASSSPTVSHALHSDQQFLAELGRALVSRSDPEAFSPRHVHQRPPTPASHF